MGPRAFVAVTDSDWFRLLSSESGLDEINFWQPSPTGVRAEVGTPWLFKLRTPMDVVVGGGFFTYYTVMPATIAWDTFGRANGVDSLEDFLSRLSRLKRSSVQRAENIGCIVLSSPFFLPREQWVPIPSDWAKNIVKGKFYDLDHGLGAELWQQVHTAMQPGLMAAAPKGQQPFGSPILVAPRLGQGAFRLMVSDAYSRRCAVSGERTLPALEAAHIKPYRIALSHEVSNGLLLRSDLHKLYDLGYVTVRPDGQFKVSRSIRDEFENGRDYYALDSKEIALPNQPAHQPKRDLLDWHYSEIYRGD
jgi:putative restriction endonuclease